MKKVFLFLIVLSSGFVYSQEDLVRCSERWKEGTVWVAKVCNLVKVECPLKVNVEILQRVGSYDYQADGYNINLDTFERKKLEGILVRKGYKPVYNDINARWGLFFETRNGEYRGASVILKDREQFSRRNHERVIFHELLEAYPLFPNAKKHDYLNEIKPNKQLSLLKRMARKLGSCEQAKEYWNIQKGFRD